MPRFQYKIILLKVTESETVLTFNASEDWHPVTFQFKANQEWVAVLLKKEIEHELNLKPGPIVFKKGIGGRKPGSKTCAAKSCRKITEPGSKLCRIHKK